VAAVALSSRRILLFHQFCILFWVAMGHELLVIRLYGISWIKWGDQKSHPRTPPKGKQAKQLLSWLGCPILRGCNQQQYATMKQTPYTADGISCAGCNGTNWPTTSIIISSGMGCNRRENGVNNMALEHRHVKSIHHHKSSMNGPFSIAMLKNQVTTKAMGSTIV
jgi:hypothetical protein